VSDFKAVKFFHEDSGFFIELVDSAQDKWKVIDGFQYVLTRSGKVIYEPLPSNRTEKFIVESRFDSFDEAKAALLQFLEAERTRKAS